MEVEERLFSIKKKIESAKTEKAQLDGKLAVQFERLKELGCTSVKEAQKRAEDLRKEAEKLESEIEEGLKRFTEEFGF